MLNELELTGRASTHVVQRTDLGAALHQDVLEAYLALKAAAGSDGIELQIVSGFRDFTAQLRIWNMKYRGERPLFDVSGNVRDPANLDVGRRIEEILCYRNNLFTRYAGHNANYRHVLLIVDVRELLDVAVREGNRAGHIAGLDGCFAQRIQHLR